MACSLECQGHRFYLTAATWHLSGMRKRRQRTGIESLAVDGWGAGNRNGFHGNQETLTKPVTVCAEMDKQRSCSHRAISLGLSTA